jgi:hypothetical protein
VDKPGQTVSATRFAEMTGVTRERLRTWERRYGFPVPHRVAGGPRRYLLGDVARVVAVRRAAEGGVPIPAAVDRTAYSDVAGTVSAATFAALVDDLPLPVMALSGPLPLRVEYLNAQLRLEDPALAVGDELTVARPEFVGTGCVRMLQDLFRSPAAGGESSHPAWSPTGGDVGRSALFRLPVQPDERPLVAMVSLQSAGEREARSEAAALRERLDALMVRDERHNRWLDAIAGLSQHFRNEPGVGVVDSGLDIVIRHTNALDGAVATYLTGQLALPGSRRGLVAPGMVTVAGHEDLARALRDAEPLWLGPAAAARFGIPQGLSASGVPIVVGGEPLGLLIMIFEEIEPHDSDNRRLVDAVAAGIGFALLRDRLARELREAVGART